jgi:hypothetical protein
MAIKYAPEVEQPDSPPLETKPQRSGGWFRRLQQRIKLALAGNDDELLVENRTDVSWRVYHNYHQLGIIDTQEQRIFKLHKHGLLSVRPFTDAGEAEYLVLSLNYNVTCAYICRRQIGEDIEVYDMRVVSTGARHD